MTRLVRYPGPVALTDPRPGDFCCVPISGGVGLGAEIGQWLDGDRFQPYDHAEIYTGQPDAAGPHGYTIGAYPGGAAKRPLPCPAAQLPGSLWSSGLIGLSAVQRAGIISWAQAHLGTPYSFLDYAELIAHRLHVPGGWLRRRIASDGHLICSQLVDASFSAAGVRLFTDGRWPGFVTPGDLAGLLQGVLDRT